MIIFEERPEYQRSGLKMNFQEESFLLLAFAILMSTKACSHDYPDQHTPTEGTNDISTKPLQLHSCQFSITLLVSFFPIVFPFKQHPWGNKVMFFASKQGEDRLYYLR